MQFHNTKEKIIIVDFGSQLTKLIARRVRDLGAYSEIITPKEKPAEEGMFLWSTVGVPLEDLKKLIYTQKYRGKVSFPQGILILN